MKQRTFYCGWKDYQPQPDKTMTSERAYNLLRAWRRNARKNSNRQRWNLEKVGLHEYRVSVPDYPQEWHFIKWGDQ